MKSVFKQKKKQGQPLLAPLSNGKRISRFSRAMRNIPVAAIPIGLTIIGSFVLVGVLAMLAMKPASVAQKAEQQVLAEVPGQPTPASSAPTSAAPVEKAAETAADLFKPDSNNLGAPAPTAQVPTNQTSLDEENPLLEISTEAETASGMQAYQQDQPATSSETGQSGENVSMPNTAPIPAPAPTPAARPTPPANNQPSAPVAAASSAGMQSGVTNSAVNVRASPNRGATVIGVIPGQAQIEVQANCEWCAVNYQGKSGYIYRSFIRYTN